MNDLNNLPKYTQESGLGKRFIGGTMWFGAAQIGTYIISFIANIFLARLLVPQTFGVFALSTSVLSILYIFAGWSFSVAVIQTNKINQRFFDTAFVLSFGLGVIFLLLAIVISIPLKSFYSIQVINIFISLAGLKVLTLLSSCYTATLTRDLDYKPVSIVLICARLLGLLVALGLAWGGFGVWSLIGKQVVFAVIRFLGMRLISAWRFQWGFDLDSARNLFSFGSQMFMSSGLESLLANSQSFLVGTILGTTALGYFDRSIMLSHLGHSLAGPAVNQVSFAAYSRLQESSRKLGKAFETINYFLFRMFFLIGIVFLFFGDEIVIFLYGNSWQTSGQLMPFLSVYVMSMTIFGNAKHLLYSKALVGGVVKVRCIQSVLLIIGMIFILPKYGLIGASSLISMIYFIGVSLLFIYIYRILNLVVRPMVLPPILAAGMAVIIYYLSENWKMLPGNSSLPVWSILMIVIVYLGSLLIIERKRLQNELEYLLRASGIITLTNT